MRKPKKISRSGARRKPPSRRAPASAPATPWHAVQSFDPLGALQLIYDTAPVGLAFLSPDGRYVQINRRLTEICGISAANHLGHTVRATVPQVADQVEKLLATVIASGQPVTGVEVHGQRADGGNADHVWSTNWHPLVRADGTVIGVNVVAEDVTESHRTRALLAAQEKALRDLNATLEQRIAAETRERLQIWNVSHDLLLVADLDGTYLSVNPAWTTTLGWSAAELVGKSSRWLLHPDDVERGRAERRRLEAEQRLVTFESRFRHKDGAYHWLSWNVAIDGERIYATGRDVTELKQAEEDLREARRELAEAAHRTTIATMSASIAHEIKQPLHAIALNAAAGLACLRMPPPDVELIREALENIRAAGIRTNEVVESVRAMFSKSERPRMAIDANDLVRQTVVMAKGELDAAGVVVDLDLSREPLGLHGHRGQLQQVIANLLNNAADAMRDVGDRPRELRIASAPDAAGRVAISVADSGTGIAPGDSERIFDAFFTTKDSGMGMGLAICRSIVEAHGGTLSVSPRAPHGSVFRMVLPRREGTHR
jgi:PAS domain S-box-containing protein